jgi:HlyD family secretion protein
VVTVGTPVLAFVDPTSYFFEVEVDEVEVGNLRLGMMADIEIDAYPGEVFKGEILGMDLTPHTTSAGGTGYYGHLGFVEGNFWGAGKLRAGLNGEARILRESKVNVLTVPSAAIRQLPDGKNYVEVWENGRRRKKEVRLGQVVDEVYEIWEGLSEGEAVILK